MSYSRTIKKPYRGDDWNKNNLNSIYFRSSKFGQESYFCLLKVAQLDLFINYIQVYL